MVESYSTSIRDNNTIHGDVVGGNKYTIQFYVLASISNDRKVDWAYYRQQRQVRVEEPYKFLSYYDTTDADIFFGREVVSDLLVTKISNHKLILINGKSGSGKTSLINAGIIPQLIKKGYFTMVFRDYGYPTKTIKEGIESLENVNIDFMGSDTLLKCLRSMTQQTGRPVAIFLDQFERFFLHLPVDRRRQFVREIGECLNEINAQEMNIVISLRQDFYGHLAEFWKLPDFHTASYHHYLEPLSQSEAIDAIKKPLQSIQARVVYDSDFLETHLVPHLLQRSEGESNEQVEPVHLQIVCNQLFEKVRIRYHHQIQAGETIIVKEDIYQELGGVEGILQGYVDVILNQHYLREEQDEVKSVLKQMVTSGGTRVFKSAAEIAENLSLLQKQVEAIIQQLDSNRLIETILEEEGQERKYSITHEYVAQKINQWSTLNERELKLATELFERCLINWKIYRKNRIPRSQFKFLQKYKTYLLKWKPEGKQLFRESGWLYHGLNAVAIGLITGLLGFTGATLYNLRQAKLNEAQISLQASKASFDAGNKQVTALIHALKASKIQHHWLLQLWKPDGQLQTEIIKRLWLAHHQTPAHSLLWHNGWVNSASFSLDSNYIVTTSEDSTAKLWNLNGKLLKTLEHKGWVKSASFSPDGKYVVSASDDGTAKLWDINGELLATLRHEDKVNGVFFSPKGNYIVTTSLNNRVQLWNLNGKPLATLDRVATESISPCIAFSPDEKYIVTQSLGQTAKLWNFKGEELATLGHQGLVFSVSFSPDSQKIVTASADKTAKVWNLKGEQLATLRHQDRVLIAYFSPDSEKIATASEDGTVKLWNLDGTELATLQWYSDYSFSLVSPIEFSPDSQKIVTLEGKTAKMWNLKGELLATLEGQEERVDRVFFSPNGKKMVTTSRDAKVRVWNLNGELLEILQGHGALFNSASFSPDGNYLVTASDDHTARVWNLKEELVYLKNGNGHQDSVRTASFSPDGNSIVTASNDGTAKLWNLNGEVLATLDEKDIEVTDASFSPDSYKIVTVSNLRGYLWNLQGTRLKTFSGAYSVSFSPNGKYLVTASDDVTYLLTSDGEGLAALEGHEDKVLSASFSSDSKKIVTISLKDKTARVWNLNGEELVTLKHEGEVTSASFSPDSEKIVTASLDGIARVWNLQGKLLTTLEGHESGVASASFSPDGNYIVTASARVDLDNITFPSGDKTARVWNLKGKRLATLRHEGDVYSASFNPDGNYIVTASSDGTAKLWNLDGEELAIFKGHKNKNPVTSASFSPDSNSIVTTSSNGTAKVWNLKGELLVTLDGSQGTVYSDSLDLDEASFPALLELTAQACSSIGYFLKHFPDVEDLVEDLEDSDRNLCDGVPVPPEN